MTIWIPETKSNEFILNRKYDEQFIADNLQQFLDVLDDVVNYGTHLILRCINDSEKSIKDVVVVTILLKQLIEQLDASSVLLKSGCVLPTYLNLRSAFEASVFIEWIINSDADEKAKAYYIWNIRRTLKWHYRVTKGTDENKAILQEMEQIEHKPSFIHNTEIQQEARKEINRLEQYLCREEYVLLNEKFDKLKIKLRDSNWYNVIFA